MRLHVVSIPHTHTTHKYINCAFTQNLLKFTKMMSNEGHEVTIYSSEYNDAIGHEHVALLTEAEREGWFGPWDKNSMFENAKWEPESEPFTTMNARAIEEIRWRMEPRDVLCLTQGWSQQIIAHATPSLTHMEYTVGYEGVGTNHRVFPSHSWMSFLYGKWRANGGDGNGNPYDIVIPHYFDPEDFYDVDDPARPERGDHLLFVGRLIGRKWPHVAADIAARVGRELHIAGPGVIRHEPGRIMTHEGRIDGPVKYIGALTRDERKEEMARAAAVIMPTQYIEPFGMVAVEAMMSGTPVIATDWGAFPETVIEGVTGARFHTPAQGAAAVERALTLDPRSVQAHARAKYGLDVIGPQYTTYMELLDTLWVAGWDT
jgi:glycosyltransferase involved in cell wall biosynthesis